MQKFYWTKPSYTARLKDESVAHPAQNLPSRYPTLPLPINTAQHGVQVTITSSASSHHQTLTPGTPRTGQQEHQSSPASHSVRVKTRDKKECYNRNKTWNHNTLHNACQGYEQVEEKDTRRDRNMINIKKGRRQSIQNVEFFKHDYANVYERSKVIGEVPESFSYTETAGQKVHNTNRQTPRSCKKRQSQKPVNRSKSCDRERIGQESYSILQAVAARAMPCVQPPCTSSGRLSPSDSMACQGSYQESGKSPAKPSQNLADRMRGRLEYVNKKMSMIRSLSAERLRGCTAVKSEDMAGGEYRRRPGTIAEVMKAIDVQEHLSVFVLNGYENLTLFKDLDEEELDYLGVWDKGQRRKLLNMVNILYPKDFTEEKEINNTGDVHSDNVDPTEFMNKDKMKLKRMQSIIK